MKEKTNETNKILVTQVQLLAMDLKAVAVQVDRLTLEIWGHMKGDRLAWGRVWWGQRSVKNNFEVSVWENWVDTVGIYKKNGYRKRIMFRKGSKSQFCTNWLRGIYETYKWK